MDQRHFRRTIALRWIAGLGLLYGGVWLFSELLAGMAGHSDVWWDLGGDLVDTDTHHIAEAIALVIVILVALIAPRWGRKWFTGWETSFTQFAAHRRQAILAAAALPIVVRLAMLPALPIPQPHVPDEFGHLLLADTFASGHLTNDTHPMWRYFESSYIFHQPTYTSVYPIAQGLTMSWPIALGISPWFGVCVSVGLMCAALCWMLQGWLPPKWALLGALTVGALNLTDYWMNSYWGGAPAAIGGALLLGGVARLLRDPRVSDACLTGLGAAILSQSRPFEGMLLCLPVGAVLASRFLSKSHRNARILAVFAGAAVLIAAGTLYYNYRVTGSPWLLPYQLGQRVYGVPPTFRGQPAILTASRVDAQRDLAKNFHWQLGLFQAQSTWRGLLAALPGKLDIFREFFFPPILALPLLFLFRLVRRNDVRFLFFLIAFVLYTEFVLYAFFFAHYAAPLYGAMLVLVLQGARAMRAARWRGRPVGAAIFRWSLVTGVVSCSLLAIGAALAPDLVVHLDSPRSQLEQALKRRGGKHLVLVRYTPAHDYQHQWIANAANIDESPVIWAREPETGDAADLLRYYSDRDIWLVNADEEEPHLIAFRPKPRSEHPYIPVSGARH